MNRFVNLSFPGVSMILGIITAGLFSYFSETLTAGDWSNMRGPNRDGIAQESGLLRSWGENGPPLLWRNTSLGASDYGMAIVGSMTYTIGVKSGVECVICMENRTGKIVWAKPIGKAPAKTPYPMQRCTPTVYKNLVYVLSSSGNLVCLNSSNGFVKWTRNIVATAGGVMPPGGYAESPYVDGKWVLVTPGGPNATVVAIDRHYGRNVWVSKGGVPAGYSSMIKASFGGEHQYVQFTGTALVGVKVRGGDFRWKFEPTAHKSGMNINTPIWFGQTVLTSSAAGTGVAWVQKVGSTFNVKEQWFNKDLKIPTGDMIKVNDNVFACTEKGLVCFSYKEGKVLWTSDSLFGSASSGSEKEKAPAKKPAAKKETAWLDFPTFLPASPAQWLLCFEENCPPSGSSAAPPVNIPPAKAGASFKRAPNPPVPAKMASMTYAEGLLYIRTSAGELALVDASAAGFKLRGKFSLPQMKKGYTPAPVISNGLLFLREGNAILCFDIHNVSSKDEKSGLRDTDGGKKVLPGMPDPPKTPTRTAPKVG